MRVLLTMLYSNIVLNIIPTLYESYIVSVHIMVMENHPVDPGSIQGSHRPISFIMWCGVYLSLIHISEPTRLRRISYAVFCLKKKKNFHKWVDLFGALEMMKTRAEATRARTRDVLETRDARARWQDDYTLVEGSSRALLAANGLTSQS